MSRQRFDPYAILRELENARTCFVLIGGLARVIQGSDELTDGLDIAPSLSQENLAPARARAREHERAARRRPAARPHRPRPAARAGDRAASDFGQIKIVPEPAGTRGYEDLRVRANRERLGHGVRPSVASPGDLVRMMEALDRQPDPLVLETMRRVLEFERRLTIER